MNFTHGFDMDENALKYFIGVEQLSSVQRSRDRHVYEPNGSYGILTECVVVSALERCFANSEMFAIF
jgi:hypothetical protein